MKKIKAAIQRVKDRLTGRKADLAKSRRRHKVFRLKAEKLEKRADRAKTKGNALLAAVINHRAQRAHAKARYWKQRVRRDHTAVDALLAIETRLEHELDDWIKKHGVVFERPNKIRGGTYEQRAHAVQVKAMSNYRHRTSTASGTSYYSMEGGPRDYTHTIFHYPSGRIYDCSTYADGSCYVTGDPSPSGPSGFTAGGFTGTELANCHRVTGKVKCGDLVVYLRFSGDTVGHHVERVLDPDKKITSGHGDAAIDIGCNGDWDIFGDGNFVIVRPPRDHHEHNLPA